MSTVVKLQTRELAKCFGELALLIPKGAKDLPVGVQLQLGRIIFYYSGGSAYMHSFEVPNQEVEKCTIIFYALDDLLNSSGSKETLLEFTDAGLHIYNEMIDLTLQHGFSNVTSPDFPLTGYVDLPDTGWKEHLQSVLGMGLDKLYAKANPITIAERTSVLKYPNTWVRCSTPAFNLKRTIDIEHIKLICKFMPKQYQVLGSDSVLFKRDAAYLMLPCRMPNDLADTDRFFAETLAKLSEPVTVNLGHYADSIRSLSKLCSKAVCNLTIYEKGLQTSIAEGNTNMSVICGTKGKVIGTAQVPINVLLVFLRALGSEMIQILIGGDIICLRNQTLVILTHVRG